MTDRDSRLIAMSAFDPLRTLEAAISLDKLTWSEKVTSCSGMPAGAPAPRLALARDERGSRRPTPCRSGSVRLD